MPSTTATLKDTTDPTPLNKIFLTNLHCWNAKWIGDGFTCKNLAMGKMLVWFGCQQSREKKSPPCMQIWSSQFLCGGELFFAKLQNILGKFVKKRRCISIYSLGVGLDAPLRRSVSPLLFNRLNGDLLEINLIAQKRTLQRREITNIPRTLSRNFDRNIRTRCRSPVAPRTRTWVYPFNQSAPFRDVSGLNRQVH